MTANQLVRNMQEKQQYHFLLGGYDLEMVTIKTILEQQGIPFSDKKLRWGAKLSAYADVLNDEDHFVGIELIEDISTPKHYTLIDHHNEFAHLNSSLEQVADLLGVRLTREQEFVAANDVGYIYAMEAMGASPEIVKEIREKDKFEQGVTALDEELALESIGKHSKMYADILCVNSLTSHFSTITDKLYPYKKLMISYQDHFVYYGDGIEQVIHRCQHLIQQKIAFRGGGNNGFFGIAKGKITLEDVESLKNEIMETVKKTKKSSHIFLFPFSYYASFKSALNTMNENKSWIKSDFKVDNVDRFNQHVYFHDFAEKILMPNDQSIVGCWEYKLLGNDAHYYIQIKGIDAPYDLSLSKVTLYMFNSQIGILSFYLDNFNTEDPEDILKINEYGRRLFPQFLVESGNHIEVCQSSFHPLSITVSNQSLDASFFSSEKPLQQNINSRIFAHEDFSYYKRFEYTEEKPNNREEKVIKLPAHILNILGETSFSDVKDKKSNSIFIKPLIDDRMFVMCCFQNSAMMDKLQKFEDGHYYYELFNNKEWVKLSSLECKNWADNNRYPFTHQMKTKRKELDFWYRYLFVDKDEATSQSVHQVMDLIKKHTYDRWINWGTLYGVSRYSFVIITGSQYEFESKLDNHFKNLYYYLVLSSLVERSSVLRFSEKVSSIAFTSIKLNLNHADIENVTHLYSDYINFINNFHLREITAQEQGIELYNMLIEKMNIENEVEFIDNEIAELHTYVNMVEDRERNRKMVSLNRLATFFLPATLVAAIFGIGYITSQSTFRWFSPMDVRVLNAIIVIGLTGFTGLVVFNFHRKINLFYRKNRNHNNQ